MSNLQCFGTDGEKALYSAFQSVYPKSIHLTCCIHFCRNIKAKLAELKVSSSIQQVITDDIFGKQVNGQFVEGLVDAASVEDYERGLGKLISKWKLLDSKENGDVSQFVQWFQCHKGATIRSTMLKPVRVKAGMGDNPPAFSTNASESINAVLKHKVEYKRNELPDFLDKLREVMEEQEREVERAVVDCGKYKFQERFRNLQKSEHEWYTKMSFTQRSTHLKRVQSTCVTQSKSKVKSANKTSKATCSRKLVSEFDKVRGSLTVAVEEFSDIVMTPSQTLHAIWKKASQLLTESGAVCYAPASQLHCMVKSSSNPRPHLISIKK